MTMIEALKALGRINDRANYKAPEQLAEELAALSDEFAALAGGKLKPHVAASVQRAIDGSDDSHDEAPPPAQVWPKQCPSCRRVLNEAAWASLPFGGYVGCVRSGGRRYAVELRHCICVSTIGVQVELPMAIALEVAPPALPTVAQNAQAAALTVFTKRDGLTLIVREDPPAEPLPTRDGPNSQNPHPCNCGAGLTPSDPHSSNCTSWVF